MLNLREQAFSSVKQIGSIKPGINKRQLKWQISPERFGENGVRYRYRRAYIN
jgi:hypothetical protein